MRGLPSVSFRLLWIFFVVFLVLSLTVSCVTTSSSPSPTPSPSPSLSPSPTPSPTPTDSQGVLYQTDFAQPDGKWLTEGDEIGGVGYRDGSYWLHSARAEQISLWQGSPIAGDFVIECTASPLGGEGYTIELYPIFYYGVLFHYENADNYLRFEISTDGYYQLDQYKDGYFQTLKKQTKSEAILSFDESNTIRITCQGSLITCEVNGQRVVQQERPAVNPGVIGLYLYPARLVDRAEVAFQSIVIRSLPGGTSPTLTPSPSHHPTPTPTASGVLFFDDFSNPISDWQIFSNAQGQSMYADGFYRVEVTEPNAFANGTLQGHSFSDFMLEVDLRPYDVPSQYRYGVVFRWQDPDNYYRFDLDNTGYFEVLKTVGGTLDYLADFTYSEAITQSETVRLKVICIGPVLTFYANDTRLGQYQDSSLAEGEIGMLVSAYEDAPVAVNFGSVRVSVPPEETPGPTPTATTAGVLYQDDFSRPRPAMLVETTDSYDLGYQDGAYRMRLTESQVPVWVTIPGDWSDAVVQVEANLQQGDEQAAYGLICRYQDEQHWYGFAISAAGSYTFFKIRGEEREDLATGLSSAIRSGQNTLSVECRGDQFVVSINGEEVDYTWDSDYYAGGVGLFVRTFEAPQATVLFDNLKVLPLP